MSTFVQNDRGRYKFWNVELTGCNITFSQGQVGRPAGRADTRAFDSPEQAREELGRSGLAAHTAYAGSEWPLYFPFLMVLTTLPSPSRKSTFVTMPCHWTKVLTLMRSTLQVRLTE